MKLTKTILVLLAVGLMTLPTAGRSEEFPTPAEWEGVWEFTNTRYDCDTGDVIEVTTNTSTMCEGEPFIPEAGDEFPLDCTGTFSSTTLDITCGMSQEIIPGCTVTITYETEGTRNGDTVTGETRFQMEYTGNCPLEEMCWRDEVVGVRLEEDPGCTSTPVTPHSWGAMKGIYR